MSRSRAPEQATGAALPAERQLCEQFGVSRVTVREALRVLEANGLVEIRVGARGGTFVRAPSKERVGEGIADYLTMSSITSADVTELRMVLELGIIPLVCERATDDDIEELLKLCRQAQEALATDGYDVGMSAEFHTRVAQCAHNGAIELVLPLPAGPAADVAAGGQAGRSRDGQARGPGAPGLCGGGQGPGRGHRHQDHARPPGTDRRQGAARGAQEAVARQAVNGPAPCGAGER